VRVAILGAAIALTGFAAPARGQHVQLTASTQVGYAVLGTGLGSRRLALGPGVSLAVIGEAWFFRASDWATLTFVGGVSAQNALSLGGGYAWDSVELSLGGDVAAYTAVLCGLRFCGRMHGLAPGADLRADVFGPWLDGGLGISVLAHGELFVGAGAPLWSGPSIAITAGPAIRWQKR
jgi:hypothetical protein